MNERITFQKRTMKETYRSSTAGCRRSMSFRLAFKHAVCKI
ncbi:hypothetical protein PO124_10875 [Bacillus licheniformis]|nr:hypothetical protein [Bacillus licheniformis]